MYTVLKNQMFELMLSLDSGSYSFSVAIQSCFQNQHFTDNCTTVYDYDTFDNFPLMADKIRVRRTDKGFVAQSNDEKIKRCLYGVPWSFGVQ